MVERKAGKPENPTPKILLWKRPDSTSDTNFAYLNPQNLRGIVTDEQKMQHLTSFARKIMEREKIPDEELIVKKQQILTLLQGGKIPRTEVRKDALSKARRILVDYKRRNFLY